MNEYLAFFLGVLCAGLGGELFVRGAAGLARLLRVKAGLIGATVVAFATSSPELSVSINAALTHQPSIALGDALGSNVVNVALILGVTLAFSRISQPGDMLRRDLPVALFIPVLTGVLCLDGEISRLDGALLLLLFASWLAATVLDGRRQRSESEGDANHQGDAPAGWLVVARGLTGLALLVLAGKLVVLGAAGIATALGVDPFVVGVIIVAIGTSAPELATAVMAKLRNLDEISLGTILGSNIFNGSFIIGIAALISPIKVPSQEVTLSLAFGILALLLCLPGRANTLERGRGAALLVLYASHLALLLRLPMP